MKIDKLFRMRFSHNAIILFSFLIIGWSYGLIRQDSRSWIKMESMIRSIPGLSSSESEKILYAFKVEFGKDDTIRSLKNDEIRNTQQIINAGIFETIAPSTIAEMAHKALLAGRRGADSEIVEDLVLIGFARPISVNQLVAASGSIRRFSQTGIDPFIYQDIISYGLANGWPSRIITEISEGLIRGHQMGVDAHKLALAFIVGIDQRSDHQSVSVIIEEETRTIQGLTEQYRIENQNQDVAFQWMQHAINAGITESVAREIYFKAAEGHWNEETIQAVYKGLIESYKAGLTLEKVALAMIIRLEQGLGRSSPEQMVREEIAYVRSKEQTRIRLLGKDRIKDFSRPVPTPRQYRVFVDSKRREPKPEIYTQTPKTQFNYKLLEQSIRSYLGTPYRWGGNSRYGIDCSGFTQAVYREQGIYIPRISRQQYRIGKPIASQNLQFGDLVFFRKYGYGYISHVGIYIGNGQFVHATTKEGVAVSSLNKQYYRVRYVGAKRVV